MRLRLILAILSTLLEEAAIVALVLWGLPKLGVFIPLAGLIIIMVTWAALSFIFYRLGSRALGRKPVIGLPDMTGCKGKAVSPLSPSGVVKVKGELWEATSDEKVNAGEEVRVIGQKDLKLIVRKLEDEAKSPPSLLRRKKL